jgi:hypothetical protein
MPGGLNHLAHHQQEDLEMAQQYQEQDLRAGLQHLAHRNQDSGQHPAQVLLQHQVGEQLQYQAAVIAIQDLERQRLHHSEPQQLVQPEVLRQQQ